MAKKTYLYYAIEENCFETEKYDATKPIERAKQLPREEYI